ncbi:uncharacterized protein KZ484_025490 [Pholidichthys leucotaenia]
MLPKGKKNQVKVWGAPEPWVPTEEAEPVPGPSVSDEDWEPGPAQEKKLKKITAAEGERLYPWRDGHQDTMAEFWLNHPIFYDKTLQHYKNKEMRIQLMQELIQQNSEDWEKLYSPLPTVTQVDAHLRNMRTRFVKLLKRKSAAPTLALSYTDQKIFDRYQFLRPHIQRNRTTATRHVPGVQRGGDDDDDGGDDDDDDEDGGDDQSLQGTQQPSISQTQYNGKGKRKNRRPLTSSTTSTVPDSDDMSETEILQQAKNLISNIVTPTRSGHKRRVRDFSRYIESELLLIPESSWDECSFTILDVIRGFRTAQQQGHLAISQQQTCRQRFGGQQQGGYYTQHSGISQQQQQSGTFQQQSSQDGAVHTQLATVNISVLGPALHTTLGLDNALNNLLSTSTPVQSPGRQQLYTPHVMPTTTSTAATTASIQIKLSGDKPGGKVKEEDSD